MQRSKPGANNGNLRVGVWWRGLQNDSEHRSLWLLKHCNLLRKLCDLPGKFLIFKSLTKHCEVLNTYLIKDYLHLCIISCSTNIWFQNGRCSAVGRRKKRPVSSQLNTCSKLTKKCDECRGRGGFSASARASKSEGCHGRWYFRFEMFQR